MTVDVLAMGIVAFLVGVLYTNSKIEHAQGRQQHENNNFHVRMKRIERTLWPNDVEDSELR